MRKWLTRVCEVGGVIGEYPALSEQEIMAIGLQKLTLEHAVISIEHLAT